LIQANCEIQPGCFRGILLYKFWGRFDDAEGVRQGIRNAGEGGR
jgi:hypothetical protein